MIKSTERNNTERGCPHMNLSSIKSRLDSFLKKEMKKEFGTTDIEQAKEMNRQRAKGHYFRGKPQPEPDTTIESEVIQDSDDEIIEGVIVDD